MRKSPHLLLIAFIMPLFWGCKATYQLGENELLLKRNIIVQTEDGVDEGELESIIKQKPNRRLFGIIPFHLYLNNWGHRGNDSSGFKKWLRKIGEGPVILDSTLTERSRHQLELFMHKKGYYNATVTDSLRLHRRRPKAKVTYIVQPNKPYTISKITFKIDDPDLLQPLRIATKATLLKPGVNCDEYILTRERERMAKEMKDQGYYNFSKEYIYFQLDSSVGNKQVNLKQIIKNPTKKVQTDFGTDSVEEIAHQVYTVNEVYISAKHNSSFDMGLPTDTIHRDGYHIIYQGHLDYKPDVLLKNIFIKPNSTYSLKNTEYSYTRLGGLRTFKFIKIRFEEDYGVENSLNCFIDLTAAPKRSFTIETEGTHRSGNLGVAATAISRNKNTFKGAEVFELRLTGGLEAQTLSEEDKEQIDNTEPNTGVVSPIFNTLEYGAEARLFIPSLVYPKSGTSVPTYTDPKTTLNMAYNFQHRPFYDRRIFNVSLKYHWKLKSYHSFHFHPIDISYIDINRDSIFDARLADLNNSLLINSYSDQLIPAIRLSYIYSNQPLNVERNFSFFRINLESSGNSLRALANPLQLKVNSEGQYEAFNVRFAQYLKTDADYRSYQVLTQTSKVVYRIFGGIGVPLQNINAMPFEKSFFGGGSNDQRAWTARTLGPGSVSDTISYSAIDQIGDVMLGGNIEYRFDVFDMIEGAAFVDAGNIWLQKNDPKRPGGEFEIERFFKEIAIGAGIGTRINFGFFIIRLDAAMPLHDPSLPEGERWIYQDKDTYNEYYGEFLENRDEAEYQRFIDRGGYRRFKVKFNLGIGYPF